MRRILADLLVHRLCFAGSRFECAIGLFNFGFASVQALGLGSYCGFEFGFLSFVRVDLARQILLATARKIESASFLRETIRNSLNSSLKLFGLF